MQINLNPQLEQIIAHNANLQGINTQQLMEKIVVEYFQPTTLYDLAMNYQGEDVAEIELDLPRNPQFSHARHQDFD
ncbi:hypothetical protein [Lonepinella koalarum]|uniref:Uncharacterized protein n=1 Tax=Lonepinella koalarum TaxID=53417 RepID=A0A4R1KPQ3_9PAST|nr:hypothetical protein [Lonepinella koalarum]MDH2926612.1 hypothetical protein [Lonepinella koalarum]TCK66932.1 hypothetical protein EV692_2202 [Lonepinella koalarum]TFJ88993.1 hypothetical protein E0709_11170 [Lonepinella koalarum]